jgi:tetratricopeptide (TPR) repeat protein
MGQVILKELKLKLLKILVLSSIFITFSINCVAKTKLFRLTKKIQSAVVKVKIFNKDNREIGQGTGFFINKDGHLITSYLVIKKAYRSEIVTYEGKIYEVIRNIAIDKNFDLAKLKVDLKGDHIPWMNVTSKEPIISEKIVVIMNPESLDKTVSNGNISDFIPVSETEKIFKLSTSIPPESSGSPVLNIQGEVIGVAVSTIEGGQNLNFAMPAKKILSMKSLDGQLYVVASPDTATINVLNIKSLFYQGIDLEPGKYNLEVSQKGYETSEIRINLDAGEKKKLTVNLLKNKPSEAELIAVEKKRLKAKQKKANRLKAEFEKSSAAEARKVEIEKSRKVEELKVELEKSREVSNRQKEELRLESSTDKFKTDSKSPGLNQSHLKQDKYEIKKTDNPKAKKWNIKSVKALARKKWETAIITSSKAILLDPGLASAYINRAAAYCEKKLYHKAIDDCKVAIFLNPEVVAPYVTLAWAYSEIEKYEPAINNCKKALALDPKNGAAYNNMGYIYHKKGNIKAAKKNYEKACNLGLNLGCDNYKLFDPPPKLEKELRHLR